MNENAVYANGDAMQVNAYVLAHNVFIQDKSSKSDIPDSGFGERPTPHMFKSSRHKKLKPSVNANNMCGFYPKGKVEFPFRTRLGEVTCGI